MGSILTNKIFVGSYFTVLLAQLINYGWWFVELLQFYSQPSSAVNFLPFLIPLGWPILTVPDAPYVALAVLASSALVVVLLFRFTAFPGPARVRSRVVVYSVLCFVLLYIGSVPLFWVWNAGTA